ncbi:hypothetical protein [Micromonospora sp. NPDC000668]|uniref:hypothetical protein n=1 Tax=Micromonospora sp. NPDC000668 TaxID=3364219 RepID=UPI0036AAEB77
MAIFRRASVRLRNWRRWTYSTLMVEKVASATALSKHPTRPIDWRAFQRAQARAKSAEVYSRPLSLWKITPA